MKTARIAALLQNDSNSEATLRIQRILDFLGAPWKTFDDLAHFARDCSDRDYAILGPLTSAADFVAPGGALTAIGRAIQNKVHSSFFFLTEDIARCSEILTTFTGSNRDDLQAVPGEHIDVNVSDHDPALTGPMHGLHAVAKVRPSDRVLAKNSRHNISTIIGAELGSFFFSYETPGLHIFANCSSEIPDLNGQVKGRWYDVREQFLSAVPLMMYLKWAFRDVIWKTSESGACFIVDDPILRPKYGFCDFRRLDVQMQQHSFSINVAVIPWNARRTSTAMASLIQNSNGRLSASIHGCDHTRGEFGTTDLRELDIMTRRAKERMERHRERTGVNHDLIIVFPQGVFSRESLKVLQQHQFVAAVNTEASPVRSEQQTLTIGDTWSVAILKYGSFPLFTRRYPAHGLENFTFDLLLGKACLIVEHHDFFNEGGRHVIKFVTALNSINVSLHWRSLSDVIQRCHQWRLGPDGEMHVRMFANELLLSNTTSHDVSYQIQKADENSVGVREVMLDGNSLEWQTDGYSILFRFTLPPGRQVLIQVRYFPAAAAVADNYPLNEIVKIAVRRYLSEFRDNFLSRHNGLMRLVQSAKAFARRD